jgi:hypothetical protein
MPSRDAVDASAFVANLKSSVEEEVDTPRSRKIGEILRLRSGQAWGTPVELMASGYSVITVDWPEISKRLRQRMFLQAIMSSLRTM